VPDSSLFDWMTNVQSHGLQALN